MHGTRLFELSVVLLLIGCTGAPPPPPTDTPVVIAPPPPPPAQSSAAAPSAVPSATASAAPPAAPTAAASVDRENCTPHPPTASVEVTNDDVVALLDAQGCGMGTSHFKANGYSYKASVDLMTEIQRRIKAGDKNGLADLVNYPLRVNLPKKTTPLVVKDRAAFLREFDHIFSPSVIDAILKEDPRFLFCNYQGVMLGRGILWADNSGKPEHLGVIAINSP